MPGRGKERKHPKVPEFTLYASYDKMWLFYLCSLFEGIYPSCSLVGWLDSGIGSGPSISYIFIKTSFFRLCTLVILNK